MSSPSNIFDVVLFFLSNLVTGQSFMSISSLVLEFWQFPFIRDWPEIRKSEIPRSKLCPISRDSGELGISNLAGTSLIKCYWKLQNARVTAFTVSELLREYQNFAKLKFSPALFEKVPSFVCFVFKIENKWILKLQNLFS